MKSIKFVLKHVLDFFAETLSLAFSLAALSVRHVLYHREIYIIPAALIAALLLGARFVNHITGRAIVDDPGVLVAYLLNGSGVALVLVLTGVTQEHFFGYRSKGGDRSQPAPLLDDLFDACITAFLLVLYSVLIFSLLR